LTEELKKLGGENTNEWKSKKHIIPLNSIFILFCKFALYDKILL
jgi:hypothetical protein